jgi:serine protease Do
MPRGGGPARRATGSGFVVRADGIVLTNNHVVERAKEITVALSDGQELPAKVLGRDPKTDLAVLKVESPTPLPVVSLGDSDRLAVGDWVVAIGNPFGLDNTVTAGIVSAKGRAIGQGPYDQFIQTDASINPGNSGGPLFDERGNVVGINTAIFSQGGGNIGIGFAIPVNVAKELVPQLEKDGHVTRGWLGVSIQKLTPELAESMGVAQKDGVLVAGITPDSPAAKAGIASGDVIQQWNGKAVDDPSALATAVAATPVGKTVPVAVHRDGATRTVEVTVDRLADDDQSADEPSSKRGRWGLAVRELTAEERRAHDLAGSEGVLVTGVAPDSPAAEAGIQPGDVVLQVNRAPIGTVAALRKAVEKTPAGKPLLLLVRPNEGSDRFAALAAR